VPLLRQLTHLPVIVDPSHATGKRALVAPLAIGGVAVGADGVMVEVHPNPDAALSDAEQQLTFDQFRSMMAQLVPVHEQVRGLRTAMSASRDESASPATAGETVGAAAPVGRH
jgi:3-deoxy-7-phosphoheptulonate synthase